MLIIPFQNQIRPSHPLLGAILAAASLIVFLLASEGPSYAVIPQDSILAWPQAKGSKISIALDEPIPFASPHAEDDMAVGLEVPPLAPDAPLSLSARLDTGPAAPAYIFKASTQDDAARALRCLTSAIYYEAASEGADGQRAVAQVVLNRVRHPAWPNSICGVVYQGSEKPGCQFTYACDGSMARVPIPAAWRRAAQIAQEALSGAVFTPVGLATYYHTLSVNPAWNKPLTITAVIGRHIFYRLSGDRGTPRAFSDRYAAKEPFPGPRRLPASAVQIAAAQWPVQMAGPVRPVRDDPRYVKDKLPESDVLPQYQLSGTWLHE